jgi:uncharacterized protein YggE
VIVNLGVIVFESELTRAKEEHDRIVRDVLAAAQKAGVSKENLKTGYLGIQPKYRETGVERVFLGYDVRQTIIVTVTDVERAEIVLSSLLDAGANQVHGVEFQSSDLRKHKDEARSLALDAAKEKAEAMGKRLGQKIGRPISITEEPAARVIPSVSNVVRVGGAEVGEAGGTMVAGRIAISARVTVRFELVE